MLQLMVEGGCVSSLGHTRSSSHEAFFPLTQKTRLFIGGNRKSAR